MKKQAFVFFITILFYVSLVAQNDSIETKFSVSGDFRFRIEQDWGSRKSDGTNREDRSRLRYRARLGVNYKINRWGKIGMRIRTGYFIKQQDPHLTIGDGLNEFGSLPIGIEKLYFEAHSGVFTGWIGKNTYPFKKHNELFWSDNVYPEGITVGAKFKESSGIFGSWSLMSGHYILRSSGTSFDKDQYFQGVQIITSFLDNKIEVFPSFYYFNNMPDVPDGNQTYFLDYAIIHLGVSVGVLKNPSIKLGGDYYNNFNNLKKNDSVPAAFRDQKQGFSLSVDVGELKGKGDLAFNATLTRLERYAIVDFLAQNDWARWDYSSMGSPDGRLSNLKGMELRGDYLLQKNFRLCLRYFIVEQLIPTGIAKETGNRIRLDLDINF